MARKQKAKGEKLGFRTYLGTTLMGASDSIASGLMTSWFMTYLTDYAGIGALGAVLGSGLLLFARLFDAVDDPLQGWIMDKAKVGRFGKYEPFILLSILFEVAGVSLMFFLPTGLKDNAVGICAWVVVGYLLYDVGCSFFAPNLVYRTLAMDSEQRGKLMIAPRMLYMILGMVTGALMSIVNGVNGNFNDLHTAFGVTVVTLMAVSGGLALLGASQIKERYHAERDEDEEPVRFTDIFKLFRENDALLCVFLNKLFSGFIWTFLFATCMYYIKYAFCADLSTGAVGNALFGTYSTIASMMMLFPLILGTAVAVPLMKLFKTPVRTYRFVLLLEAALCGIMYLLQLVGMLEGAPVVGYLHWSLLDNFEWQAGYAKTLGLVAVDRTTLGRRPKESLRVLGELAAAV